MNTTTQYTNNAVAVMNPLAIATLFVNCEGLNSKQSGHQGWKLRKAAQALVEAGEGDSIFATSDKEAKAPTKATSKATDKPVKVGKASMLSASSLSDSVKSALTGGMMMAGLGDTSQASIKAAFEGGSGTMLESMLLNVLKAEDVASVKNWAGVMTLADKCLGLIRTNVINAKVQEEAYLTLLNAGWEIDRQIGNAETCKAERYLPLLHSIAKRGDVETLDEVRMQLASGIMPLIITGDKVVLDDFAMDTSRRFHYVPTAPTKATKATKVAKAA